MAKTFALLALLVVMLGCSATGRIVFEEEKQKPFVVAEKAQYSICISDTKVKPDTKISYDLGQGLPFSAYAYLATHPYVKDNLVSRMRLIFKQAEECSNDQGSFDFVLVYDYAVAGDRFKRDSTSSRLDIDVRNRHGRNVHHESYSGKIEIPKETLAENTRKQFVAGIVTGASLGTLFPVAFPVLLSAETRLLEVTIANDISQKVDLFCDNLIMYGPANLGKERGL